MKVALVHYHLRTGGVSSVIAAQCAALDALGIDHLVFSAGPITQNLPCAIIPALDYCRHPHHSPHDLLRQLEASFHMHFGVQPSLWHFHNPTLGKNILFPDLLEELAKRQTPLLLQLHDLAEDNRPDNYPLLASPHIYPQAPQIHYACINQRDRNLLTKAGLHNVHWLPNAIRLPELTATPVSPPTSPPLVFYPVRAIRRKNLGELLLLSALAPAGTRFAIALEPDNPQWHPIYERWQELATELQLPILFHVVGKIPPSQSAQSSYSDWLQHATHLITTSIAEGFGLTFLEPILLGKPLLGRDLSEITADFKQVGITTGTLYSQIPIPLSLLDQSTLRAHFEFQLTAQFQTYGHQLSDLAIETAWQEKTKENHIDYGELPETFQETILRIVVRHPAQLPPSLLAFKNWLAETLCQTHSTAHPSQLAPFSLEKSGSRLLKVYQHAIEAPPQAPTWLPKEAVLKQYLHPQRFHLLRT